MRKIFRIKLFLAFFFTIISNFVYAQNIWEGYTDPFQQPSAPGYEQFQKAQYLWIMQKYTEAYEAYYKSALEGNYCAYFNAIQMLLEGKYVAQDIETFKNGLSDLALNGKYPPAQYQFAVFLANGSYFNKDISGAFFFFKQAADQGLICAKRDVARCYIEGLGTTRDVVAGMKITEELASSGDTESMRVLGNYYYNGWGGYNQDYNKAISLYEAAAEKGNIDACLCLALVYIDGNGVDKDYSKAKEKIFFAEKFIKSQEESGTQIRPEVKAQALYMKGYIYYMEEKKTDAISIWKKLKTDFPDILTQMIDEENEYCKAMFSIDGENKQLPKQNSLTINTIEQNKIVITSDIDQKIPENRIINTPTFAVIIANEKYNDLEKVPYASHDGEIFKQYCEKTLGIPLNNIRYVPDATLNNIKRQVSWLTQVMEAYNGEANVIFYYAGHGIPDESNRSSYLLPVDGVGNDVTTGYSLEKLYAELSSKPAKSVVVLLDACFSGAQRDGGMLASARGVAIKAKQEAPKGNMVVISAAQGDETAYPYKEKGHGMFTYYLLKKLQDSKGNCSLGELADYVTSEVKKQSVVINGKMQTPAAIASGGASNWKSWKLR